MNYNTLYIKIVKSKCDFCDFILMKLFHYFILKFIKMYEVIQYIVWNTDLKRIFCLNLKLEN